MADEIVLPIPNLNLPQCLFLLSSPTQTHHHEKARKELLDGIQSDRKLFLFPVEPTNEPTWNRNGTIPQTNNLPPLLSVTPT